MKKVLALALAFVLVMGMATIGSAATNKITLSGYGWSSSADNYKNMGSISPDRAEIKLYLDNTDFGLLATDTLTTSLLSNAKIDVTAKKTNGYACLDSVKLKNDSTQKKVYVEVKFIKELVSTKSVDFDYTIALTVKGKKQTDTELTIAGTMENEKIEVDEDTDTVDLSDGAYAEASEYSKSVEIEAGNGVYVTINMFKDQKYYCKAIMDVVGDDKTLVDKYPQIDTVVQLNTINIPKSAAVKFDMSDKYYVYDAAGKYIGTSADKLPMSAKYYLSTSKIDMGDTTVEEPSDSTTAPSEPANPITGGDDAAPNANDNPGTGANGFVNVAVVAGLVALAAAGAVSMKK
jgi:hypothetical protein